MPRLLVLDNTTANGNEFKYFEGFGERLLEHHERSKGRQGELNGFGH